MDTLVSCDVLQGHMAFIVPSLCNTVNESSYVAGDMGSWHGTLPKYERQIKLKMNIYRTHCLGGLSCVMSKLCQLRLNLFFAV